MYTIFLAGGIASGKSTVAFGLQALGALRIDLDQLSREVLSDANCIEEIAAHFGADLIDGDGTIKRSLLAERAFANQEKLELLESIEHPHIIDLLIQKLEQAQEQDISLVVVEIPLLDRVEEFFELADEIICVTLPLDIRRERARARGMELADFEQRLQYQPNDEWLVAHADTIIDNSGTEEELKRAVLAWWSDWNEREKDEASA